MDEGDRWFGLLERSVRRWCWCDADGLSGGEMMARARVTGSGKKMENR